MEKKSILTKLELKKEYILYISFFLLGLHAYKIYTPVFLVLMLLMVLNKEQIKVSKEYLLLGSLMLISVLPLYFFGKELMTVASPIKQMLVMLFLIVVAGFFLQKQEAEVKKNIVIFFVLGLGFEALIIASYSYLIDPIKYGYGLLYNPFMGVEQNSPSISNNLSILAALLICLFIDQHIVKKLFYLCVLFWIVFLALFLQGRSFFIILFFALVFVFFNRSGIKKILIVLCAFFILILVAVYSISHVEVINEYFNNIGIRFYNIMDTPRFQHYAHGLSEILYYPFGGYRVDKNIESVEWFHNVFLDNGRLGGWLPVMALISMCFYILSSIFLKKNRYFVLGFTLFLVGFLIMQQDVVIEGDFRSMILVFFSGILLLSKENNEKLSST